MPSNARCTLILAWTICLLPLTVIRGATQELPFLIGEKLSYLISWSFIPAGRATLEVIPAQDNDPAGSTYHFTMTAHTLPAVAWIYPYREKIHSYVAEGLEHGIMYTKSQESGHPRDIAVRFDWRAGTAQYSNFGQTESPIPVPPGTLDPLSALYFIRTQQLTSHVTLERAVSDGKKISLGKAKFLSKETLAIRGKTYQTIKIEPDLRDVKGVFEKSPGAAMYIWLTDDNNKILVKLKSEVRVGSFVAELIEEESVMPEASEPGRAGNAIPASRQTQPPETMGNNSSTP